VRVKPTVITPKYKWGSVSRHSIGTVTGEMLETSLLHTEQMARMHVYRVVSPEISGNLFQSFRKFPEIFRKVLYLENFRKFLLKI